MTEGHFQLSYSNTFQARIYIDTTETAEHSEIPFVGVSGCFFYDRDPSDADAVKFDLIDENGCNDSPNYYNPFAAATQPGVNGMYLNQKPIDKELTEGKPCCF